MARSADLSSNNCFSAEYENIMHEIQGDDLSEKQLLSSSNCQYILIRNPSTQLSFFDTFTDQIIYKWILPSDQSIWSINPHFTNSSTITITNNGCLTFFNNTSPSSQICINTDTTTTTTTTTTPPITSTTKNTQNTEDEFFFDIIDLSSTYSSIPPQQTNNDPLQQLEIFSEVQNPEIWIPIALCILGVSCALIFLIINCIFRKRGDYTYDEDFGKTYTKTQKEASLSDSIESITDDEDPEIKDNYNNNNNNVRYRIQVSQHMISVDDDDGDDERDENYNDPNNKDNSPEFDLSDCRPISDDCYVTQRVISTGLTPGNKTGIQLLKEDNDDESDIDTNTGLMVPHQLLIKGQFAGASSSSGSELEIGCGGIGEYAAGGSIMMGRSKLSVIQDVPDIDFIRNRTVEMDEEDETESSDDDEEHVIQA